MEGIITAGMAKAARHAAEEGSTYTLRVVPGGKRHQDTKRLSLSMLGSCQRKLAYKHLGHEPLPIDDRTIMIFRMGHLLEAEAVWLIRHAIKNNMFDGHKVQLRKAGGHQAMNSLSRSPAAPQHSQLADCSKLIMWQFIQTICIFSS